MKIWSQILAPHRDKRVELINSVFVVYYLLCLQMLQLSKQLSVLIRTERIKEKNPIDGSIALFVNEKKNNVR